jgi:hypothetical protein
MTGAIESRMASTVRVGSEVTRTIDHVTHVGRVTDSKVLVGLGHQIVLFCTECREPHYWTVSPKTLITTRTER